ncbi:MAG: VOC family protein, partial [Acidimicrobiales bacterium]
YVRDVERSVRFYADVLGFRPIVQFPGAAFLRAADSTNDHDLGLFQIGDGAEDSAAGRRSVGLYHLAWEVDTLGELQRVAGVLRQAGALVGASDHHSTKSLYAKDPDGLEFEVCWLLPADALPDPSQVDASQVDPRPLPLDLDAEIARFGADTLGGIGVSVPATTA